MISQDIINKMNAIKAAQQVKADKPQATFNARQEAEKPKEDKPQEYDNLQDITQAANSGKLISLSNLSNLVNLDKRPRKDAAPTPPPQAEPTPKATPAETGHNLEYFTILWHEGYQVPNYENTLFINWDTIQEAFFKLWEVNEKDQDGGYTKVKCKIKLTGKAEFITRVDITNRIGNGDFNPTDEHITHYLIDAIEAAEPEAEEITEDTARPELSGYTIEEILTGYEPKEPTEDTETEQEPTTQPEPATVTPQPFKIERYTPEPTTNPQPLQILRYNPQPQPEPQPERVTAIVRENKAKKGIEIIFSSKPKDSILEALRANNWRYSKYQNLWYNLMSEDAVKFAQNLANL